MTQSTIKDKLAADLKASMLAGDQMRLTVVRALKSVILYAEVAAGTREQGLDDNEIIALFAKESKKRQESAQLYVSGGAPDKAEAELAEKVIIDEYLPEQLGEDDITKLVDDAIAATGAAAPSDMGKVIGAVKARAGASADGSLIARIAKARLSSDGGAQ